MVEGGPHIRLFVGGVLQFDDYQRQAVDEKHDVGPAGALFPLHGELVDGQEVVVGGGVEVHDMGLGPGDGAICAAIFHIDALDQHAVEGPVAGFQGGARRIGEAAEGVV